MLADSADRPALSVRAMTIRSAALSLLLFGGLLPHGATIQAAAAVFCAPFVFYELQRPFPRMHPAIFLIVPLFAALYASVFWHPPLGEYGATKLRELMTLSLFTGLAASMVRDRAHLVIFARVWGLFGFILALTSFVGAAGNAGRAIGFGGNPIGLARPMASAIVVIVWLMMTGRLARIVGVPAIAVMFVGLFATGSKGPTLAACLAILLLVLLSKRLKTVRLIQLALAVGVGYAAIQQSEFLRNSRVGTFILSPEGLSDPAREGAISGSLRVLSYQKGGSGYGSWEWVTGGTLLQYPHNIWLEVAIESGVIIAAILIAYVLTVLVRLIRSAGADPFAQLAASLLLCEIVSASLTGDIRVRSLWLFLTLGYMVIRWDRPTPLRTTQRPQQRLASRA